MTPQQIIDWFGGINESRMDQGGNVVDLEKMMYMHKQLSVASVNISNEIYMKGCAFKTSYQQKKISYATEFLNLKEGTATERGHKATKVTQAIALDSAKLDGQLSGYKIKLEQINKVLASMNNYIHTMRPL